MRLHRQHPGTAPAHAGHAIGPASDAAPGLARFGTSPGRLDPLPKTLRDLAPDQSPFLMKLDLLNQRLTYLQLPFTREHYAALAQEAAAQQWDHLHYLDSLIQSEFDQRRQRVIQRRVKEARFPVLKTLEQFRWDWPKKINRLAVQSLFRLGFLKEKANVIFLGTVGLGKTHLATALGYAACLEGHSVLFANAINVINELSAAQ